MGLLAAHACISGAACVVQAGTAVTIDALAPGGQHEGGLIVPGLDLMMAALLCGTSRLGAAVQAGAAGPSADGLALDTGAAIRLGPLLALHALVQHCAAAATRRHGPTRVVLTGGSAPALLAGLEGPVVHRPMLVLEGLALRYGEAPATTAVVGLPTRG
jgi:type III pantothenate kinase